MNSAAGFNRMNYSSGIPEPLFNVNGAQTPLPYFKLKSYADMGGAGGGASVVRDNTFQAYDNCLLPERPASHQGRRRMDVHPVRPDYRSPTFTALISSPSGQTARSFGHRRDRVAFWRASCSATRRSPAGRCGAQRMDGHQPIGSFYVQDQIRVTTKLTRRSRTAL